MNAAPSRSVSLKFPVNGEKNRERVGSFGFSSIDFRSNACAIGFFVISPRNLTGTKNRRSGSSPDVPTFPRFGTNVASCCRLPPRSALTLASRSRSLIGVDPCCAYQACKNSKIRWRKESSDLMVTSVAPGRRNRARKRITVPGGPSGKTAERHPGLEVVLPIPPPDCEHEQGAAPVGFGSDLRPALRAGRHRRRG